MGSSFQIIHTMTEESLSTESSDTSKRDGSLLFSCFEFGFKFDFRGIIPDPILQYIVVLKSLPHFGLRVPQF